jgi:hypothetical protein
MASNPIQILYSGTPSATPVLGIGATDNNIALNGPDEKLFYYDGTTTKSFDMSLVATGLQNVVEDLTPQLGGNLDVNGNDIVSVSNGDINISPDGTGKVVITGDLDVTGTATTINSTTLQVDDKNIELGTVTTPTDITADGGGITLKGTTDKTITWDNTNDNWSFNQSVNLSSGLEYKINNVKIIDATSLGSTVVSSSLTSVGTLTAGTWQADVIALNYGGTGADLSGLAAGALFKMNGGQTAFVAAVLDTDYIDPNSLVGGETF